MSVRWQIYPTSLRPSEFVHAIASVFESQSDLIGTPPNKPQSDQVLKAVSGGLSALGFQVETSKRSKIRVPIQYGVNGDVLKSFEVDAWHQELGAVLEVEAGIAIDARKIYQDLFEALAMPDVHFLCVAVQNAYHPARKRTAFDDLGRGKAIFDGLFASQRMRLPLETVMLLGY
jgi:hypothetical protein